MKITLELVSQLWNQYKKDHDDSLDEWLDGWDWIKIKLDKDFEIEDWFGIDTVLQAKCLERIEKAHLEIVSCKNSIPQTSCVSFTPYYSGKA